MTRLGGACYRYRQHLSLALLAAAVAAARPLTGRAALDRALDGASFLMVLAGGALRSWAMGYHVWRRVHGPGSERRLVTAGPYALVRNPLYTGTLMIAAGIALMSGWWPLIAAYAAIFWLGYYAIILWEEQRLEGQFGGEYLEYRRRVPRLVPRTRVWSRRQGAFSLSTMMRCMEPVKTIAFLAALAVMVFLKAARASGG